MGGWAGEKGQASVFGKDKWRLERRCGLGGKLRDGAKWCRKEAAAPHEAPSGKGTNASWLVDSLF